MSDASDVSDPDSFDIYHHYEFDDEINEYCRRYGLKPLEETSPCCHLRAAPEEYSSFDSTISDEDDVQGVQDGFHRETQQERVQPGLIPNSPTQSLCSTNGSPNDAISLQDRMLHPPEVHSHQETQQWISDRSAYELEISSINYELSEYKQKLDIAVNETLMFQKHAEDSKLDYQTKLKTFKEKYKEICDVVVKYDRKMSEFEEKLAEMYKQSAASLVSTHGSVASLPQSFQESDLPGKLHILEKIMKEKDAKLQELEKIIQKQKEVVLKKVSRNHNHVADSDVSVTVFDCYRGDLSEASPEKLREHIEKLESVLYTTEQRYDRQEGEWISTFHSCIQNRDSQQKVYEMKISMINDELSQYKQKLDLVVSETLMFQKHAEDSKLHYQTKMKTLTEKYNEQIFDILKIYDRQMREFEEKLVEMYKQSAASLVSTHGSVTNLPQSFQESDLPGKLHILERIMNVKDAKLQELEKIIQEKKEVALKKVSRNHNNVANSDRSVTDFECYHGDLSEASPEKLRKHIKKIESVLHITKQKCNSEVSDLTQQHQKESEISVRLREEEFQAELQYFLKEKEDQWKTRMETTVKQHEQALKQADEKHKCVLHETICEYEHKNVELQKIIDEYNKFRSDKEMEQGESTCVRDTFSLRDKMKDAIVLLEEKYITEKATLERKVKQIEEVKGDKIVNLCLCQAEDARKLKETYNAALSSLKAEYHNIIRQLEQNLSLQKSEVDKAHELAELLKEENECDKLVVEQLQKEVEQLNGAGERMRKLLEKMNEEEEKMREELEKMNEEEEKMREELEKINEEELEKLNEEEEKMRKTLDKIKKEEEERMKEEQENIKDTQQWISDRSAYELKISRISEELSEYKQKLDLAASETLVFQKQVEDSKLEYQIKMKTLTEKYKEEISDIVVKYDRQTREFEEKLLDMYKQSAASLVNKHGSAANLSQSFQESDLPGKLHILEKIMKEKDAKLQELEKIIQDQTDVVLKKASRNHNHVADSNVSVTVFDCYLGDLSEASLEKLREHIKKLESVLHTFSLRDKMKHAIFLLEEKYITEKATLERKVKQIEEVKGDEIVSLCQEEDTRKLKETFDATLSSLKAEHHNVIRQLKQELSLQKSEVDKAHELAELLKEENECDKLVVEQLQKEVERLKVSSSDKQIKEQREKWFLEAQEYINT